MFIVDYSGTRIYNLNMAERIGIEEDEITLYYRGEREVLAKYDPSYPEVSRGVYLLSVIADLQDRSTAENILPMLHRQGCMQRF